MDYGFRAVKEGLQPFPLDGGKDTARTVWITPV